jgi:hypothetical protein
MRLAMKPHAHAKEKTMKRLALLSLLSVLVLTGCSFHIPGPLFEEDYFPVTVRLAIEPDDAEVYLDGRLIGEAYEFSSHQTALRLSSRNHRLTLRKDGFFETVVDLDAYRSGRITLSLDLQPLKGEAAPPPPLPEAPQTEGVPPPPNDEEEAEIVPEERYALVLTVEPAEATLYVNGRFWGIAPATGKIGRIAFAEAEIKLDVFKPGFKPFSKKIALTEKGEELTVKLEEAK